MEWEHSQKWLWKADRVSRRRYPLHGTMNVMNGRLMGRTDSDYFHFDCPRCGEELDAELIGVRDDSWEMHPSARTIVLGLTCPSCGLEDLMKIGCLESSGYQPRRQRAVRKEVS